MKTVTIQIGNSDDKLTQRKWSNYCRDVEANLIRWSARIHFNGCSLGSQPWQNACWVFEIADKHVEGIRVGMAEIRADYGQESIAWTEGETAFI